MKFNDIVKSNFDEIEDILKNAKVFFNNLLKKDVDVRLRIVDPRIKHFSCYTKLDKNVLDRVMAEFPDIEVKKGLFKIKELLKYGRLGFTIYNVSDRKKDKLIRKHDKKHEKELEYVKKNHIIF